MVSTVRAGLLRSVCCGFMLRSVERELCEERSGEARSWGERRGGADAKVRVWVERFTWA